MGYIPVSVVKVRVGKQNVNRGAFVETLQTEFWKNRTGPKNSKDKNIFRIFPAHENFSEMINRIELVLVPPFNRLYRAKKEINVGEVIIRSRPFASVVNKTVKRYCLTCHEERNVFIPCDQCPNVNFCSLDCKDKNEAHKYECRTEFHNVQYRMNDIDIKLALQVVLEALAIFNGSAASLRRFVEKMPVVIGASNEVDSDEGQPPPNPRELPERITDKKSRFECFMNLHTERDINIKASEVEKGFNNIMNLPKVVEKFRTIKDQSFLQHFIAHDLAIIKANCFHEKFGATRRALIYDSISFFNHSCAPNVLQFIFKKEKTYSRRRRTIHMLLEFRR